MAKEEPQYWVVGATTKGQDMIDYFVNHGFWFGDKPEVQDTIEKIRPSDRIAIKRMIGRGAKEVAIHAIGVVEEVQNHKALPIKMIYVRWIHLPEDRKVPFGGFGGTIHGPYSKTEPKMQEIFML
jgi:hypothetical protein